MASCRRRHTSAAIAGLVLAIPALGQTEPTSKPTGDQDLVPFLIDVYTKKLASKNWLDRSLAVLSLDRLPGEAATDAILKVCSKDATPVVRVVAWQAILGRAKWLTDNQYALWTDITGQMVNKQMFPGETRVGLLRMLAISPPTPGGKKIVATIFSQTNALRSHDLPVLDALGDCIAAWRSPDLMTFLFNQLSNPNDAYRAEYVLHRAGCDAPWAGERMDLGSVPMWKLAIGNYADWWRRKQPQWQPITSFSADAYKSLPAQLVVPPDLDTPIDPKDRYWVREEELVDPDLRPLDVVFIVDATGSMQPTLDFLLANIGRIKSSLELVSQHVRIGVTCYRDFGDTFITRATKLTDRLNSLDAFLGTIEAHGGGDRPEAVREALVSAFTEQPWSTDAGTRKAAILMTDAPPHPESQQDCVKLAATAKDHSLSLQIMKVRSTTDDQSDMVALDALAEANGTDPMWMATPPEFSFPYTPPQAADDAEHGACMIAPEPNAADADQLILQRLMALAIDPQYANRIEPLVNVLLAVTSQSDAEKRTPFGVPENDSGGNAEQKHDPQER